MRAISHAASAFKLEAASSRKIKAPSVKVTAPAVTRETSVKVVDDFLPLEVASSPKVKAPTVTIKAPTVKVTAPAVTIQALAVTRETSVKVVDDFLPLEVFERLVTDHVDAMPPARGNVCVLVLQGQGTLVLTPVDSTAHVQRIKVVPNQAIAWSNRRYHHKLEPNDLELCRMLGPYSTQDWAEKLVRPKSPKGVWEMTHSSFQFAYTHVPSHPTMNDSPPNRYLQGNRHGQS